MRNATALLIEGHYKHLMSEAGRRADKLFDEIEPLIVTAEECINKDNSDGFLYNQANIVAGLVKHRYFTLAQRIIEYVERSFNTCIADEHDCIVQELDEVAHAAYTRGEVVGE
jgi:hypothetical protein